MILVQALINRILFCQFVRGGIIFGRRRGGTKLILKFSLFGFVIKYIDAAILGKLERYVYHAQEPFSALGSLGC